MRALRILLVVGLVLIGVAAALPFRRTSRESPVPDRMRQMIDVPLRRADVALEVSPVSPYSPAAGLHERPESGSAEDTAIDVAAHRALRQDLESLAPPPNLPPDFAALAAGLETSRRQWQPARMKLPSSSPSLRRHRLTDGDSLERLAERYLGNAARSGEIYDINRDVLREPDLLPLGRIIRIPAQ